MFGIKPPRVETEIIVAEEILAGDRSIYTVIEVSALKAEDGKALGSWLVPLAMLIIEPGLQYAVSITGEEMPLEAILQLAPSLKTAIEKGLRSHKIKNDLKKGFESNRSHTCHFTSTSQRQGALASQRAFFAPAHHLFWREWLCAGTCASMAWRLPAPQ